MLRVLLLGVVLSAGYFSVLTGFRVSSPTVAVVSPHLAIATVPRYGICNSMPMPC
jgi:hypothetical protein